ncbi:MAG: aminotransferase class I/II-fold pyridoxal phosphate-dependent enzyme [Planctomycetes bacterium]|nr:aminotransferase class I/II-fold pyridoxal phosphate-dependent enzyme [Planctomycetota bacterium]
MPDFRSDTITRPTREMRDAMASAVVGDDVFGEDPTVARLERAAADLLGMDAAVFVPSGTMANQVAIHVHCRSGDEAICDARAHVALFEAGAAARFSGVTLRGLASEDGFPSVGAIDAAIQPDDVHRTRTRLLALENTHNMAGGTVLDAVGVADRVACARRHGLVVHVDGARLVNASVAAGASPAELVRGADSVSLCLSKGLGAPVGSVLAGNAGFVAEARRARKAFGGGMRQAGVVAAAGLIALRDGPELLARDHERATRLAEGLRDVAGVRPHTPQTNMVMLDVAPGRAASLVDFIARREVYALAVLADRIRFVVHRDLEESAIERCLEAVRAWASTDQSSDP